MNLPSTWPQSGICETSDIWQSIPASAVVQIAGCVIQEAPWGMGSLTPR
jgi:hypothetical protein